MKHIFLLLLVILTVSCTARGLDLNNLKKEAWEAQKTNDNEKLEALSNMIDDDYFYGEDAISYMKFKIYLLSLLGDYESLLLLYKQYENVVSTNYQLLLSRAVCEYRVSGDYSFYYRKVIELLNSNDRKDELELLTLYYVLCIVEYKNSDDIKFYVRESLKKTDILKLLDDYDNMKLKILVKNVPIDFFMYYPMSIDKM